MKTDKVKLDTSQIEINKDYKSNTKSPLTFQEGISFIDFLNDQLSFGQLKQDSFCSFSVKDEKDSDKNIKKTTSETISSTNDNSVNNNVDIQNSEKSQLETDKDFAEQYMKINAKNLSHEDLKQVYEIINNNGIGININQINGFNYQLINYNESGYSYRSLSFSKNLDELLSKAYKTNRPVRIDLENNSSVILKIDKDGKLSAQFLSADKAMEMLLKENLYLLRAKLDEEGLPYKELSYKDQSSDNNYQQPEEDK